MNKLKPCPFCGGNAVIWEGPDYYKIACQYQFKCAAQVGPYDTEQEAVKAWGNRYEPPKEDNNG